MDEVDISEEREYIARENSLRAVRLAAERFDPGVAGECAYCGQYFTRVVNSACARCRDERNIN